MVWVVGSQQGCMGNLDDCIIHGVYPDKQSAIQSILDLQRDAPSDVFGMIPLPLGTTVNVGFNVNHDWRWYEAADGSEDDGWTDVSSVGGGTCSSACTSDASMVRLVEHHHQKVHMSLLHRNARLSAPCNITAPV